ncbi:MAG: NADH-quinone oxidoreductase subunit L [Opitutales bacterium]|nr:NADH-quinone oxidoreductase subunit L [Opitutales bacterium]
MYDLLWLIPALPFVGFLILTLAARSLSQRVAAVIACGTVGVSAVLTLGMIAGFLWNPPADYAHTVTLWQWMPLNSLEIAFNLRIDALSLVMASVITVVGFLIHLYSSEYMQGDEAYTRFFAYLNLFVGFMLILVMADNFALLLLGWEGVGLCSYLLIGFWYQKPENGFAARKAFVVTRIGDVSLLVAVFLIFSELGTLQLSEVLALAPDRWAEGSTTAWVVSLLLLGGAVGKSAQLPLQTWLPDAMAGPTPVSALIHAATMVTAGVYLIARMHGIFELSPSAMTVVALVGTVTLLTAGCAALVQSDIKRVLAYSTISQLGYMFLALGVGAWAGALFHFMTHAWFKALLFLAAGSVIAALHHEQNIHRMGGLRKRLPVLFWTFVAGAACLAALPLVTSGFYSKEKILWDVWISPLGGPWFWSAAILGALITALYSTRLIMLVFFGEAKTEVSHRPGKRSSFVLIVLAVWSLIGGGIEVPHNFGHLTLLSNFLETAIPASVELPPGLDLQLWILLLVASAIVTGGVLATVWLYGSGSPLRQKISDRTSGLQRFWLGGWGFDTAYDRLLVQPIVWLSQINRRDGVDGLCRVAVSLGRTGHFLLSTTQQGRLRRYAIGISAGALALLILMLLQ